MESIFSQTLVKTDVDCNNNKWWKVVIYQDFTAHVTNGRVGGNGQVQKPKSFPNEPAAMRFAESKIREKTRDGYTPFKGITGGGTVNRQEASRMDLEVAASEQIRTRHKDVVSDLIKRLVMANVHSILKSTDLKYDEVTGVFETPLGVVTQDSIDEARKLLGRISKHILGDDFDSDAIKKLVASYLMLIPQKVGRKLVIRDLMPNQEALDKQSGILDDLESSIAQVAELRKKQAEEKSDTVVKLPNIFDCEINVVEDLDVIATINKFFNSTRQKMHSSYDLKIKRIFELKIDHMDAAYEAEGKAFANEQRLWHGTRPGNVLSILKSGLIITPVGSFQNSGRAFGNGVYHSDQSTKSLQYSNGYHAGTNERQVFMFLCDVAMGKPYMAQSSDCRLHEYGHDSVFAKAGIRGLANNEMIVFSTSQTNPRFLVEFCD